MSVNQFFNVSPDFKPDFVLCNHPFYAELGYEEKADRNIHYFFHFKKDWEREVADKLGFDYEEYAYLATEKNTVQEILQERSGHRQQRVSQGASVIVPALCMGVLLEPSILYYIGVEMDYRLRYAGDRNRHALDSWRLRNKINTWEKAEAQFDRLRPRVLSDIRLIKNSAQFLGIEVRNLTWEREDNVYSVLFGEGHVS